MYLLPGFCKMFLLVLLSSTVSAGVVPDKTTTPAPTYAPPAPTYTPSAAYGSEVEHPLGQGTGNDEYMVSDPDHYIQNEVYKTGAKDICHPVEKVVYVDECVPYLEKTCFTIQREECKDQFERNCTAVIDSFQERECFNVTELICQLAENIEYEMVNEAYTVQKCTRVADRVCDTVYDLAVQSKDEYQCVDIDFQYCWDEEKLVKDRTCVYSVEFECSKAHVYQGTACTKTPTKKCYDSPRKVKQLNCKPRTNKWCEKFSNEFPMPIEKQNCHSEPMKKCELEVRSRPKKAKKYVYVKECKPISRQVCDDGTKKKLRPVCDKIHNNICSYAPEEKCTEVEKKYCYKLEKKVVEKVCLPVRSDSYQDTISYV